VRVLVEPTDEGVEAAAKRELFEETGLVARSLALLHEGPADPSMVQPGRASVVHVFRVAVPEGARPEEREHGCPISWLTRNEFLSRVPFRAFYTAVFEKLEREWEVGDWYVDPPTRFG
jgi:8-oxo-dGTP pyrophosphatase MutT (NUDIX family)